MTASASPGGDDLVRAWAAAPDKLDAASLAGIRRWAVGALRRAGLAADADLEDIVDDAIARMWKAIESGGIYPESAPAYMSTVVRNAAIDRARRRRREIALNVGELDSIAHPSIAAEDEALIRFARVADIATIAALLRRLTDAGEDLDALVLSVWLDLAAATGQVPTTRQVGAVAGVSHATVANVLRRVGKRVAADRP